MALQRETMAKVMWRILPFICVLYFVAFIDRVNVGFAALHMNADLGMSSTAYGIGAGMFFIGYFLFEVPSNMLLKKVGVRLTVARIMVLWGMLAAAMAFIQTPTQFYVLRFLIGVAEAGFSPAMLYYLTTWFPSGYRGRAVAIFSTMMPVSSMIGAPLSTWIMASTDGILGHHGWQWMFVLEALPAVALGICVYFLLPESPLRVRWLNYDQRMWLIKELSCEAEIKEHHLSHGQWKAIAKRHTVLLILILGGTVFGLYGAGFWIAQIVKSFGHTDQATGFISAIPYLFACIGMVYWGRHSDRARERIWHIVIPVWISAAGFVVAYFYLSDPTIAVIALIFCMTGIFSALPSFWALTSMLYTSATVAVGIAVINSFANLTGYIAPMVIGLLRDASGGFASGMIVLGAALFCAGAAALLVRQDMDEATIRKAENASGAISDPYPTAGELMGISRGSAGQIRR